MSEIWFRDPFNHHREIAEVGHPWVVISVKTMPKRGYSTPVFCSTAFAGLQWRALQIGQEYTLAWDYNCDLKSGANHLGSYPTWHYGEDWQQLEDYLGNPVGEQEELCIGTGIDVTCRPLYGQPHRVIVANLPNLSSMSGRRVLADIKLMQQDYPEAIVHLHGTYSWKGLFGCGLASGDIEVRETARKGNVFLPTGKSISYDQAPRYARWIMDLGMLPVDLTVPRNRCMYNLRSAVWAAEHYMSLTGTASHSVDGPRQLADRHRAIPEPVSRIALAQAQPSDKLVCDKCSLSLACKLYREGSVCTLPESEGKQLAKLFRSRNVDDILDGMSAVMGKQAERAERAVQVEDSLDDLDPEVTRLLRALMSDGIKLAKLLDPERFAPKPQVFLPGSASVRISGGNAETGVRQAVSVVLRQFELEGVPRDKVTPAMLEQALARRTIDQSGNPA